MKWLGHFTVSICSGRQKKLTETEKPVIYTAILFKKSSYV